MLHCNTFIFNITFKVLSYKILQIYKILQNFPLNTKREKKINIIY